MKLTSISSIALGASLALAAPSNILDKRFTLTGVPSSDVNCPDWTTGKDSTFTSAYVSNNLDMQFSRGKKMGSYPKPFNPNNPHAGEFTWVNGCTSDKVLEYPMWKNSAGNEIPWVENLAWGNNNKPGAYREYYMLEGDNAIWCGAYAHADGDSNGSFKSCTW